MSHLISRILLAILLFPLASLFYLVAFTMIFRAQVGSVWFSRDSDYVIITAALTWIFLGIYWYLLWRKSVRFNPPRLTGTLIAAVLAALAGALIMTLLWSIDRDVASFVGSAAAPLLWLIATCFLWRESREERAARLEAGRESIICPACGYNLTGLAGTRCPECGKQYTLDELLAGQPSRVGGELQRSA